MKVKLYGNSYNLNIDYRLNEKDKDSIKHAIEYNVPIRAITRIKLYHQIIKRIKAGYTSFMCNALNDILSHRNIVYGSRKTFSIILPEFKRSLYFKITNTEYIPLYDNVNSAWDWARCKENRIKFLEYIKREVAKEYLQYKLQ